ncbi:MAG: glycosyl hydrolase [bacterium]
MNEIYKLFLDPPNEFSQLPWWFWNDEITESGIIHQLNEFRKQGIYGFTIQARMGLPRSIPYLGKRWFELVRFAVEEAKKYGMIVHLYDEGMYPSGSAHGQVVDGYPEFLAHGLEMRKIAQGEKIILSENEKCIAILPEGNTESISFDNNFPESGYIFVITPSNGTIRGVHEGEDDRQPLAPKAADILNPDAVKRFIELTHERYYNELKEFFGSTIQAFFTDEPSILGRCTKSGLKPWTDGLENDFLSIKGYDIIPHLPALWLEVGSQTTKIRRDYEDVIANRLNKSFYQQISDWCAEHNIALTGHPAESDDIGSLKYFHIPGQDLVWRYVEPEKPSALEGKHSTVGKCSSSAGKHQKARRNGNEVYGAYGWKLTLDEMKWIADWLMVRGTNLLWPHAFYYSIRDFRSQERPPDLGLHNLWWKHYNIFANYTKRICYMLTDSDFLTDIAILGRHNHLPWEPAKVLFQNQYDFDYITNDDLNSSIIHDGRIMLGNSSYNVLICMIDHPLNDETEKKLKEFIQFGGNIITFNPSENNKIFLKQIKKFVPPDITIEPSNPDLRYTHIRKSGYDFYYLTNEGINTIEGKLTLRSSGYAEWWDPVTGEASQATVLSKNNDKITVKLNLQKREGVILAIDKTRPVKIQRNYDTQNITKKIDISSGWSLIDPNTGNVISEGMPNWVNLNGYENFSGTLLYEREVDIDNLGFFNKGKLILDLGEVHDFAEVYCNDINIGTKLWTPFRFLVPVCQGKIKLKIFVTNSIANRIENASLTSGIIGPITLQQMLGDK